VDCLIHIPSLNGCGMEAQSTVKILRAGFAPDLQRTARTVDEQGIAAESPKLFSKHGYFV
jgi:hypothetical protein